MSNTTLSLPQEAVDKIQKVINTKDAAGMDRFLIDAINSYMELGRLVASGTELHLKDPESGASRRVRLPFEQQS